MTKIGDVRPYMHEGKFNKNLEDYSFKLKDSIVNSSPVYYGILALGVAAGLAARTSIVIARKFRSAIKKADSIDLTTGLAKRVLSEDDAIKAMKMTREYPEGFDEIYYSVDNRGFVVTEQSIDKKTVRIYDDKSRKLKERTDVYFTPRGLFDFSDTFNFNPPGSIIGHRTTTEKKLK